MFREICVLSCSLSLGANAVVVTFQVPRLSSAPEIFVTGGESAIDIDGDSILEMTLAEGNGSICTGNGLSVSCRAGFRVTFEPGFEVFGELKYLTVVEPTQLSEGQLIANLLPGKIGNWIPSETFSFSRNFSSNVVTGESQIIDSFPAVSEQAFLAFRQVRADGFSYGFFEINQPIFSQENALSGLPQYPHIVGVSWETTQNTAITTTAIPEPSTLIQCAGTALVALRRKREKKKPQRKVFDTAQEGSSDGS